MGFIHVPSVLDRSRWKHWIMWLPDAQDCTHHCRYCILRDSFMHYWLELFLQSKIHGSSRLLHARGLFTQPMVYKCLYSKFIWIASFQCTAWRYTCLLVCTGDTYLPNSNQLMYINISITSLWRLLSLMHTTWIIYALYVFIIILQSAFIIHIVCIAIIMMTRKGDCVYTSGVLNCIGLHTLK